MPILADIDLSSGSGLEGLEWCLCGAVAEGERIRETVIGQSRFWVGRRSTCDLRLSWATVSSLHAEFVMTPNSLFLRDTGSTNGTFVNGRRIHSDTAVAEGDVIQFGSAEFRVRRRGEEDVRGTMKWSADGLSSRLVGFDQLAQGYGLVPFYQPIVSLSNASTVGFEVLARSQIQEFPGPREMFETADQLGRAHELSNACRYAGVRNGFGIPIGQQLFLNTDPAELEGDELITSLEKLRNLAPEQALSLEIHEAAVTDLQAMAELRCRLIDLNIGLAYDDFGAGQARMLDLVEVPPDVLKFDISLVRNIHNTSLKRQKMVSTLVSLVKDFGIAPLAEGVETREEAEACRELGFDFAQGFYFGRPADDWRSPLASTGL